MARSFKQRATKAIVEEIKNKLKLLKCSSFGLINFNNFEILALLCWHYPKDLAY
ncbi:MAG: transposase [Aphanothece sp. CMT-3BRIN-NPC111]|nr:transposase [Aphanothece sp. CMT-3BRIN-NPC111]